MLKEKFDIEKKIIFDEPMKKHTSFRVGGLADLFVKVKTEEELKEVIQYSKNRNIPIYILGNGSNILVTDKGIRGIVIKIDFQDLEIKKLENSVDVTVGSGYKLMALAQKLLEQEISGFEELSGIPGTIGGAIYMNAGAYGKEIKDICVSTKCMDYTGKIFELTNEEQKFEYRSSVFSTKNWIILGTKLKLSYGKKQEIQEKMTEYLNSRKQKQPLEFPSAGSTFKRQEGIITAKLIDECNLKGYSIGGAMVSDKHAGFIINYNNATARDILDLIKYVKQKVYEKYGIKIQEEIKILGEL